MNLFANPVRIMWICRVVPVVLWGILLWELCFGPTAHEHLTAVDVAFALSLAAYLALVYALLPVLFWEGVRPSLVGRIGYWLFAGLTAGLGPTAYYWLAIDRVLRCMVRESHRSRPADFHSASER